MLVELATGLALTAAASDWALVWSDEFDGQALDLTKWSYAVDCAGGYNNERQCYTDSPANVSVRDGLLRLTALRQSVTGAALPLDNPGRAQAGLKTLPYSSGKIHSQGKASWRYGRIEARARAPGGQGAWPAIWMMPEHSRYGGWPLSGEIDIMEAVNLGAVCGDCPGGRENRVFGTAHFGPAPPNNRKHGGQTVPPPSADGFHVYAVEWSPREIVWFVDGQPYFTARAEDWRQAGAASDTVPFDQPFYLILNLAFGGNWPESVNAKGVDEAALPATLEIDWVRVRQRR